MSPSARPVRRLLLALVFFSQVPALVTMAALLYVQYLREVDAVSDEMRDRAEMIVNALDASPGARFRDLLDHETLPPQWIVTIVNRGGTVITRRPGHEQFAGMQVGPELLARIRADDDDPRQYATFHRRTIDGIDVVSAIRRSAANRWTVVVSVPDDVLYAPVWRSAAVLSAVFVMVFATSVAAALFTSGQIGSCIRRLRDAAASLASGHPVKVGELCFAEAQQLGATLEQAGAEINAANAELHRVTQGFHRALVREVETQQASISRELHDSVGSSLAGVSMLIGNARASTKDPRVSVLLEKAQEQVNRSSQDVREISRGMMPAGSEAGGLAAAIEQYASNVNSFEQVHCTARVRGDCSRVPPETAAHAYRIVQEAVTNAIRHGDAKSIRITLAALGKHCRLTISDDGKGCDFRSLPHSHSGMGLRSMQARARAIDGRFDIAPQRRGGARVRLQWAI
jgi:signal transduction histidine kinase